MNLQSWGIGSFGVSSQLCHRDEEWVIKQVKPIQMQQEVENVRQTEEQLGDKVWTHWDTASNLQALMDNK